MTVTKTPLEHQMGALLAEYTKLRKAVTVLHERIDALETTPSTVRTSSTTSAKPKASAPHAPTLNDRGRDVLRALVAAQSTGAEGTSVRASQVAKQMGSTFAPPVARSLRWLHENEYVEENPPKQYRITDKGMGAIESR